MVSGQNEHDLCVWSWNKPCNLQTQSQILALKFHIVSDEFIGREHAVWEGELKDFLRQSLVAPLIWPFSSLTVSHVHVTKWRSRPALGVSSLSKAACGRSLRQHLSSETNYMCPLWLLCVQLKLALWSAGSHTTLSVFVLRHERERGHLTAIRDLVCLFFFFYCRDHEGVTFPSALQGASDLQVFHAALCCCQYSHSPPQVLVM